MILLDKYYWEARYLNNTTGWDLGHISRPIKEYVDQLKNKDLKILIPGAGNSYEAEYLMGRGFKNITVIDIVKEPLKNLESRITKNNSITLIQEDFFNHTGSYDIIIEQTFFCALELRFRESYFKKASQLLNREGLLIGILFNFSQTRTTPPFGGSKNEYLRLSRPYFNILKMEECYNSEPSRQGKELFLKIIKK